MLVNMFTGINMEGVFMKVFLEFSVNNCRKHSNFPHFMFLI